MECLPRCHRVGQTRKRKSKASIAQAFRRSVAQNTRLHPAANRRQKPPLASRRRSCEPECPDSLGFVMTQSENRLKDSASPYLRSAAHQPIDWYEWGPQACEAARAAGKPILLDIGAVWCHWCHVIDRESYENPEIAAMINQLYIPVKVDRDERPDVDARYQSAISAISGQGGWPLTAFLTPDGKPFFGGTYFPPEDAMGRPGFKGILLGVSEAFRNQRADVDNSARALEEAVEKAELHHAARGSLDSS